MMLAARWDDYDPRLPRDLLAGGVAVSGLFDLEPVRHAPYLNADLQLTLDRADTAPPPLKWAARIWRMVMVRALA